MPFCFRIVRVCFYRLQFPWDWRRVPPVLSLITQPVFSGRHHCCRWFQCPCSLLGRDGGHVVGPFSAPPDRINYGYSTILLSSENGLFLADTNFRHIVGHQLSWHYPFIFRVDLRLIAVPLVTGGAEQSKRANQLYLNLWTWLISWCQIAFPCIFFCFRLYLSLCTTEDCWTFLSTLGDSNFLDVRSLLVVSGFGSHQHENDLSFTNVSGY